MPPGCGNLFPFPSRGGQTLSPSPASSPSPGSSVPTAWTCEPPGPATVTGCASAGCWAPPEEGGQRGIGVQLLRKVLSTLNSSVSWRTRPATNNPRWLHLNRPVQASRRAHLQTLGSQITGVPHGGTAGHPQCPRCPRGGGGHDMKTMAPPSQTFRPTQVPRISLL